MKIKNVLTALTAMILILGVSEAVLYACGSKFLVSGKSSPLLRQLQANSDPTTVLVYWSQDEDTEDEDRWSPNAEEYLGEVGHEVLATFDDDSFLAAARDGVFEVLMVKHGDLERLGERVNEAAPDAVILPIVITPTRSERRAVEREYGRVLDLPTNLESFLKKINDAGNAY